MRIVFCGVGALGSTALSFCRNFQACWVLVDFDRVESKNLSVQAYVKQSVGKNKAQAMAMQLANFYGIKCEAKGVRVCRENLVALLNGADLAVDCLDNAAGRELLSDYAKSHQLPLIHAATSADGAFAMIRWDQRFSADREDYTGQATCDGGEHLPLIGLAASCLARSIQDFVTQKRQWDYMVSLHGIRCVYDGP